jgi:inner membrane protein
MKHVLFWKGLAVAGLALLLIVPLMMIEGQISARKQRETEVETNIAQSSAGHQQITGPLLVLDYRETVAEWVRDEKSGELLNDPNTGRHFTRDVQRDRTCILVAKTLVTDGEIHVEERHRGLYKAQLFHLNANLKGRFDVPANLGLPANHGPITLGHARLVVAVSDLRGVQNRPHLTWDGQDREFDPGPTCNAFGRGLVVDLGPVASLQPRSYSMEIPSLQVLGTQEISVAPIADDNQIKLRSDWANPSFGGRFLPTRHQIGDKGFEAQWQISSLARNLDQILATETSAEVFKIEFVEPVNIYLQSERAVKYGFLFVGLVFAGFFFFEMLKRLPIHPMQYFLVGLSLALFFLLLISLSEHIPFLAAYGAASVASIVLLGFYLSSVLEGWAMSLAFSGGLTLLYGVLYGLLASEDNALLMGALLLFAALAGTMMATRKLDWYNLSGRREGSE